MKLAELPPICLIPSSVPKGLKISMAPMDATFQSLRGQSCHHGIPQTPTQMKMDKCCVHTAQFGISCSIAIMLANFFNRKCQMFLEDRHQEQGSWEFLTKCQCMELHLAAKKSSRLSASVCSLIWWLKS
ncbi:hypothetical protein SKAU_G00070630 [Synaphobranchus kaupii]|uniref:Uncharacterized protein n=1 Tax=Synaphobranchus kaupii TaxID=118154 RepID=A0A9Q1G7K4_SYNKA|nr:hypothetical protein SKAU_G00070630 [Synaphobranchus kaupii]